MEGLFSQLSSIQNPGWLFDIGDYTTQLYGDYFISQYKDPYHKLIRISWNVIILGIGSHCSAMFPRNPGSPNLRMGAWNLNDRAAFCFGDWTPLNLIS